MPQQETRKLTPDTTDVATRELTPPGDLLEEPLEEPLPVAIPDYQMLRRIGAGGFSEVWLARNRHDWQYYAVKLIRPDRQVELDGVRFYQRCTTHPGLLPLLHVGWASGRYYIVMPLADSASGSMPILDPDEYEPMTLDRWRRRRGRLQLDEIVRLGESLLNAVDHLHEAGLVHGDIKPGNILRVGSTWRLADFGSVCRDGSHHVHIYTPEYAPPEGGGSRGADLYAIGIVLLEMITGAHRSRPALSQDPMTVPCVHDRRIQRFGQITRRALDPDPAKRFDTALEMRHELRSCLVSRAAIVAHTIERVA